MYRIPSFLTITFSNTGWICDHGGKAKRIKEGDVVWCPPGAHHWHGADDNAIMSHFIFALGGTEWYEKVTEEELSEQVGMGWSVCRFRTFRRVAWRLCKYFLPRASARL